MSATRNLSWAVLCPLVAVSGGGGQTAQSCRAERWVQVYAGGPYRPHYPPDSLMPYVAVIDRHGRPTSWFTTGAIVTEFRSAGGAFLNWSPGAPQMLGEDWQALLDSVFAPEGVMARLDTVVGRATAILGARQRPFDVALVVPYPDERRGAFAFGGGSFDLGTLVGRVGVVEAYIAEAARRFGAAHYRYLRLTGVYWLNEGIRPEDLIAIQGFAAKVHQYHLDFIWNPDFFDFTHKHWQSVWALGFDRVLLQQDYFIDTTASAARLDTAIALARSQSVGIDVEFDNRLFSGPAFARRLEPYLASLDAAPDLREGPMMLYEGGGALARLATSGDSMLRNLYDHLASTFRVPVAAPHCR